MNFTGKTAFITGGARGIGKALAKGVLDARGQLCAFITPMYIQCKCESYMYDCTMHADLT